MEGVSALQVFYYLAVLTWIVVIAYKMIKIARMPLHLRWDLYPIPHEKGKGEYGGSYFEEVDWWTKPLNFSLLSELKEMGKEIVFIQSVYRNNRFLWYFTFPFHFGLYAGIMFALLMFFSAILEVNGVAVSGPDISALGSIVSALIVLVGAVAWFTGAFGAVGLFFLRLIKPDLRNCSVRADYFNLALLAAIFIAAIFAWVADPSYAGLRQFVVAVVTFSGHGPLATPLVVKLILSIVFLFYMPFTHMTHMVAKYFTYHKVRWEDEPNIKGSKIEKVVQQSLGRTISWAAPHIKTGATWAEAATAVDEEDKNGK